METIIADQDSSISDFGKIAANFQIPEKKEVSFPTKQLLNSQQTGTQYFQY
jgi:hypothetical protein